jgi:hypothetical protein
MNIGDNLLEENDTSLIRSHEVRKIIGLEIDRNFLERLRKTTKSLNYNIFILFFVFIRIFHPVVS